MKMFRKKKYTRSSWPACNVCASKKVKCEPVMGVGQPCKRCLDGGLAPECTWPSQLGSGPTAPDALGPPSQRGVRVCRRCKDKRVRCLPKIHDSVSCATCERDGAPCSFAEGHRVADGAGSAYGYCVAGPSTQGMAATNYHYQAPQSQQAITGGSHPPSLTIDTSSAASDGSIGSALLTPSSRPNSPRSWWEIVMLQDSEEEQ